MMDRAFESSWLDRPSNWQSPGWGFPVDVVEKEDEFVVRASLPGINPEDLDITLTGNTLTVKGEAKGEEEAEKDRYYVRERFYGSFARSFTLPTDVKADDIQASYEAGELVLHLPKTEEVKPKRIAIQGGGSPKSCIGTISLH
jgi:HSP20 family protein